MARRSTDHLLDLLTGRPRLIIATFLVISALLVIPLLAMAPDENASQEPGGEVFELQEEIEERFAPSVHTVFFILEDPDGDALDQESLWALYQRQQELLAADQRGDLAPDDLPSQPYLTTAYDADSGRSFFGINSLADAVQAMLQAHPALGTTLEHASDEQVKLALHELFTSPETAGLLETLSIKATSEPMAVDGREIQRWESPAFTFSVYADAEPLGGAGFSSLSADDATIDREEFNLNMQEILRGEETPYELWGVAIDLNTEIEREGQLAGQFITLTVIAAVGIIGIALRSYWAVALSGAGLGLLMIWLKGISNLIGLEGGLIVSLIVPIAMISLGIDFAVHALRRYQEERSIGVDPRRALRLGFAGVLSALFIAAISDSVAFLSNTISGIEAIIHFGIAAAIAVLSSFLILGIVVPVAMMQVDEYRDRLPDSNTARHRVLRVAGGVAVASFTGAAVILFTAVSPPAGVVVLAVSILLTVAIPWWMLARRAESVGDTGDVDTSASPLLRADVGRTLIAPLVATTARLRWVALPVVALLTILAGYQALQLEATFDVKDFFDSSSDFVVSLDKADEHIGDRGGETAFILIEGDLADPDAVESLATFVDDLEESPQIARDGSGELELGEPNLFSILRAVTTDEETRALVSSATAVPISDADGNGIPDSREQIAAIYDFALERGVPGDSDTPLYSAGEAGTALDRAGDGDFAANLKIAVAGSREQTNVTLAREQIEHAFVDLEASPLITRTGLTGSPFTREKTLEATTESLQLSIPIAAVGALIVLLIAFRSVRQALVTLVPVGLVVMWLYAIMEIGGFALNFVTATIGAVSIGVGIDYAIHMTERFREEMRRQGDQLEAARAAAAGTGAALVASAASSVVGFGILGFAPMPMFASYGILTAIMIALALIAALLVLPALLLLVERPAPAVDHSPSRKTPVSS